MSYFDADERLENTQRPRPPRPTPPAPATSQRTTPPPPTALFAADERLAATPTLTPHTTPPPTPRTTPPPSTALFAADERLAAAPPLTIALPAASPAVSGIPLPPMPPAPSLAAPPTTEATSPFTLPGLAEIDRALRENAALVATNGVFVQTTRPDKSKKKRRS